MTCVGTEMIGEHYEANRQHLVKRYFYLGDGSEDVVQEAYERALRYGNSFDGSDFNRWMNTILLNAMRDQRRDIMTRGEEALEEYDHVGDVCNGLDNRIWDEVFALIDEKSPEHAQVLNLFFDLGYTYKEISMVTDNTYHNAYRIVERFRKELAKLYKD